MASGKRTSFNEYFHTKILSLKIFTHINRFPKKYIYDKENTSNKAFSVRHLFAGNLISKFFCKTKR